MKVKFELEIDEKTFDQICDSIVSPEGIDLNLLFKGRVGHVKTFEKNRDRIYGIGGRPVGMKTSKGTIDMIVT